MKQYFSIYSLKDSLIVSIFLSLPLYLIHFGIDFKFLNTFIILIGLFLFYKSDIKSYPLIGFFTSILWLWWISTSLIYYNLYYLIPFVIFLIGLFYGFVFWIFTFLRYKVIIILLSAV